MKFSAIPPCLAADLRQILGVAMDLPNKMLIASRILSGRGDCENFPDNNPTIIYQSSETVPPFFIISTI